LKSFVERWLGGSGHKPVEPRVPDGERVYCIGDIHGRLDLLQKLHERIEADVSGFDGARTLVYLGDYIDRGPQSREVIDRLLSDPLAGFQSVHLLGNHEQVMLDFLEDPHAVAGWLTYGGIATLQSYGVHVGPDFSRSELENLRDGLESRLPEAHRAFLDGLQLMHLSGNYCFVHAGIRPGVPLQEQRNEDLLWIREDFTHSAFVHEHVVVHGHTISAEVEILPNRIGIDTGAFHSGVLTCLVLEADTQRLLQTGRAAR
jgi:serine/threonine protein phosphatase 1